MLGPPGRHAARTQRATANLRNIVRLFFKAERINPWTVLGCLLVASVVEGIGFASLVPLLWIVTDPAQAETSPVIEFTRGWADVVGLPLNVGTLVVFFVCTLIVRSLLTLVAMRHVGYAVAEFSTGLQARLIQNLFRARWDYLVQHRSGRVASAMGGQADRAGRAYYLAAMFFAQVIQTAGYLVVAFIVSWPLALASVGVGGRDDPPPAFPRARGAQGGRTTDPMDQRAGHLPGRTR